MTMTETKKLYDLDSYKTEFEAMVVACEKIEEVEGLVYRIALDQTLFFPEEGGQTPDQGTLQGIEVNDVQIENEIVWHTMNEPLEVGTGVKGVIDWKHRFSNMQQHSGEHIFSGLVNARFGFDNVGFHLSDQVVTMDFNGVLSQEEVEEIELAANEVIIGNLPIQVSLPSKEELVHLQYRSKIEIEGQVRIVTIPGVDICACCAPHARTTGEIGMLKVMTVQSHRGGVRISFLCGFRALEDYRERMRVISTLSSSLSANLSTLPEAVERVKKAVQTLKAELVTTKQAYMEVKLNGLSKELENVFLFESNLEAADMRNVINRLVTEHSGYCGIFVGNDEEGYRFIIGSNEKDCREVIGKLKEKFEVKGGGSQKMVQGSLVGSREKIEEII